MELYSSTNKTKTVKDGILEDFDRIKNIFGKALNKAMTKNGISKKSLAKQYDIDPSTVFYWVKGSSFPKPNIFFDLLKRFDLYLDVFPEIKQRLEKSQEETAIYKKFFENQMKTPLEAQMHSIKDKLREIEAKIEDPTATKMNVKDVGIQPPDFK